MLVTSIPLPRDGAAYHCTFTKDGIRCGVPTKRGLVLPDYDKLNAAKPTGVTFMRALCKEHIHEVSTFIPRTEK